jgi:hypothetical protein
MKKFSNFSGNALSTFSMKNIIGGKVEPHDCHTWYIDSRGVEQRDTEHLTEAEAKSVSAAQVRAYGAGFGWSCPNAA